MKPLIFLVGVINGKLLAKGKLGRVVQIHELSVTFWKTQKLIPSKKKLSLLIAKISSCKAQKIANPQKSPANISCHA